MAITIKIRRGTLANIETNVPEMGQLIVDTTNNRIYIGDEIEYRGFDLLRGDRNTVDNCSYYGSNTYGVRGFNVFAKDIDILPNEMRLAGNSSKTTIFSDNVDCIEMPTGLDSSVFMLIPITKFIDISKDIIVDIVYNLSSTTSSQKVKLENDVWIVNNGYTVGASPDSSYTDYITSKDSANIYRMSLFNTKIESSDLTAVDVKEKFVLIRITRSGSEVEDDYTGSFNLINVSIKQAIGGIPYGYYFGGLRYPGPGIVATDEIRRLTFPMDYSVDTMLQVSNLSSTREGTSACNSSTKAFIFGGGITYSLSDPDYMTKEIDTVSFPFDSGSPVSFGNLAGTRMYSSACNSSSQGFIMGGTYDTTPSTLVYYLSTIERVYLSFESGVTGVHVGDLSVGRLACSGFNSSTHGYSVGGYNANVLDATYAEPISSVIDRITFPFNSGTASKVGTLGMTNLSAKTQGTLGAATCNSSAHGFILGGQALSSVDRIAFPFDSGTSTTFGNLSTSRSRNSGCNSSINGYSISGTNAGSNTEYTQVDRIDFPFATGNATTVGNLAGTTISYFNASATDGTDFVNMLI